MARPEHNGHTDSQESGTTAMGGSDGHGTNEDGDASGQSKRTRGNPLTSIFGKLGLDKPTLTAMFKGSIPPTIGIAMYQATAVSSYFTTIGYLIPVISVLAMTIMPRGKFFMNLLLNLLAVCFGLAVSMLALWSAVQARLNTESQPAPPNYTYNSSQSAVLGVWLFANIYLGNVVRAKLPAFNLPVIVYSIIINVASTFGPFMTTTAAARAFIEKLLAAMLLGLGLALGVNLVIFPVSSRLVLFKEFAGAIGLLRKIVALQKEYLLSLESDNILRAATQTETFLPKAEANDSSRERGEEGEEGSGLTKEAEAAKALETAAASMRELAGKLNTDLPFAKRDIARGRLDAKDLSELLKLFRNVYVPVQGMVTIIDILKRFSEHPRAGVASGGQEDGVAESVTEKNLNEVMKQVHEPFEILSGAIDQGLEHAGIVLELLPKRDRKATRRTTKPASDPDVEAGDEAKPGTSGFARILDEKLQAFQSRKSELLRTWVHEKGIHLDESNTDPSPFPSERDQVQLYIVLYMEKLMHEAGTAVRDLVDFADEKVEDGTMSRNRLIVPSFRRLRKWFWSVFSYGESSEEQTSGAMGMGSSANIVYFGDGYNRKSDPEHLPPATPWQRFGNGLRKVSKFFASEESVFGFRAACATMSIGIVAFLEPTQVFFMEQRLFWAMIIVSFGLTMTSGQSFFGFLLRVAGTVVAMCLSLIEWYIVDGQTPGVIVFLWLFILICYYFFIKFPRFIPGVMITIVTQCLIIGYELQVRSIGVRVAEANGQPFYPTYLLAPYRLACVAGGSLVAFFWTIFPSPLTDRTWLRRDLSATLYLLANYFGVIHSTLRSNVHGTAGDVNMPGTPAHHLFKVGRKIFGKVMTLIPSMSQHSEWQRWEPTIGGKFPREAYDQIIMRSTRIMAYLTLTEHTLMHPTRISLRDRDRDRDRDAGEADDGRSQHYHYGQQYSGGFPTSSPNPSRNPSVSTANREWLSALAEVLEVLKPTHHTIVSTLTLLSNSLLSGQRLPPFLPLPRPYELTRRLICMSQSQQQHIPDDLAAVADLPPIKMVDSRTGLEDYQYPSFHHGEGKKGNDIRYRRDAVANILDPRNIEQPGYAEFAVLQVCTTLVCDDLEGLVRSVSGLVGVVDFSFRLGPGEEGGSDSTLDLERSGKRGARGKGKAD